MPALEDIAAHAAAERLMVMGAFHPGPDDILPDRVGTVVLLGPAEPGFWAHVTAAPEFSDAHPDPLDRWSRRVIGQMACALGGRVCFPFDGPPWHPFVAWAQRTGRAWVSPVGMLVHDTAGLMASYRGALLLRTRLTLPDLPAMSPCAHCADAPCLVACPVGALGALGYDLAACHAYLDSCAGKHDCLSRGCAVRRACPLSQSYGRLPEQSSYHMRRFHP